MANVKRGMLIVVEGIDGSGKSTIVNKICDFFEQRNDIVNKMVFPDRTTIIGQMINKCLQGETRIEPETLHLLFGANRREKKNIIIETLMKGEYIICDRYCYSGMAYSMSLGVNREWCCNIECGMPEPDLVFYIDVDPKITLERLGKRIENGKDTKEIYDNIEFQRIVYDNFNTLFTNQSNIRTCFIDGTHTQESVKQHVYKELYEFMIQVGLNKLYYTSIHMLSI